MPETRETKEKSFVGAALVIAAAAALILGGLAGWLRARAADMREKLATSIERYDKMKDLRQRLETLRQRSRGAPQEDVDASKISTYLSQKAGKSQLAPAIRTSTPPKSGAWSEIATTVDVRGTKEQPVARSTFVEFLADVERERPYLKSKGLSLTFSQNELSAAQAVISYFKR